MLRRVYSGDRWGSKLKWNKGFLVAGQRQHNYLIIIVALSPRACSLLKANALLQTFAIAMSLSKKLKSARAFQSCTEWNWKKPFLSHHKVSYFVPWTRISACSNFIDSLLLFVRTSNSYAWSNLEAYRCDFTKQTIQTKEKQKSDSAIYFILLV